MRLAHIIKVQQNLYASVEIFFYRSPVMAKKKKKNEKSFADTQNMILKNEFLTSHSLY